MSTPSLFQRAKAFIALRWHWLLLGLALLGGLVGAFFRRRSGPVIPDSGPTPLEQSDAAHDAEERIRASAREASAAQEAALQRTAELEAAAKLRAAEDRLRDAGAEAATDVSLANQYADQLSRRKP